MKQTQGCMVNRYWLLASHSEALFGFVVHCTSLFMSSTGSALPPQS